MKRGYHNILLPAFTIALAVLSCFCLSCGTAQETLTSSTTTQVAVIEVSPVQANALIQKNQGNPEFIILDVRTPDEYSGGHLANALNVDFNASDFRDAVNKLDRNRTYLVYCRTGVRSAAASEVMAELGFKYINNMTGGFTEWQAQGLPVVK